MSESTSPQCSTRGARRRQRADRHLTAALERAEEGALGARIEHRPGVAERRHRGASHLVVAADLYRDRTLPRRGKPVRRLEKRRNALRHAESVKAGGGEDRGVYVSVVDLLEPRRHVAAQFDDLEIVASREQLRASPQARRSDARTRRQIVERINADDRAHDERVARVLSRQERDDFEAGRTVRREILERVHAELNLALREIHLELSREEPFATDGRERLVEMLVARGAVGLELARHTARLERLLHLARLPQRELGGARRDDERSAGAVRHGRASADAAPAR